MASDVDPSIPLSVKPVQIDNPMDVQANAYKLKQLGIQTQQAQQDYQDSQTIRSIYQNNVDPKSGQLDMNGFSRDGYSAGLGAKVAPVIAGVLANRKTGSEIDKNEGDANSANASANASTFKLAQDRAANLSNHLAALIGNPNLQRQDVIDGVNQMVGEHSLDAGARDQLINMIPQNDADLKPWLVRMGMQNQDFSKQLAARKDMAPTQAPVNLGNGTRLDTIDPLTGQRTVGATVAQNVSPDTQANITKDYTVAGMNPDGTPGAGALSEQAKDLMARRLLQGEDPSKVMGNMGRGAQGARDIRDVNNRVADMAKAQGVDASGILSNMQGVHADTTEAGVLGHREGAIAPRVQELLNFVSQARDASAAVPRGNWTDANKLFQFGAAHSSDPNLARLQTTVDGVINARAAAIGGGQIHVADQIEGHKLLAAAQGPEAFNAVMDQFEKEGQGALAAPGQVRTQMGIGGTRTAGSPAGAAPGAPAAPAGAAPTGAGVPIKSEADYAALPSGTPFIAPDGSHRVKP